MRKDRDEITRLAGKKKSGVGLSLACLILGALLFAAGLMLLPRESGETDTQLLLPSFVGQSREEALQWLTEQGFTVHFTQEYSDSVREGFVISQSLPVGTVVKENMEIGLCLSLGREPESAEERKEAPPSNEEEEQPVQDYRPPAAVATPGVAPTEKPEATAAPTPAPELPPQESEQKPEATPEPPAEGDEAAPEATDELPPQENGD